ncbi:hypothetical protein ABZP36_014177 [Zizania latifolia]
MFYPEQRTRQGNSFRKIRDHRASPPITRPAFKQARCLTVAACSDQFEHSNPVSVLVKAIQRCLAKFRKAADGHEYGTHLLCCNCQHIKLCHDNKRTENVTTTKLTQHKVSTW